MNAGVACRHHLAAVQEVASTGKPHVIDSSLKRGALEELHTEVMLLPVLDRDARTPLRFVGLFYFT